MCWKKNKFFDRQAGRQEDAEKVGHHQEAVGVAEPHREERDVVAVGRCARAPGDVLGRT